MNRLPFATVAVAAALAIGVSPTAAAQSSDPSRWFFGTDVQGLVLDYGDAPSRERLQNFGLFVRADYLERAGFTIGYNRTQLSFADGAADVEQDNLFLSGRWSLTPDSLPGRLTLRLDAYSLANDDATGTTDDVEVLAPQLAYLNFAQTFYFDIGYARGRYGADTPGQEPLEVDQLTPTLGFGLNAQRDWLQLRAYLIDLSDPARAQGRSSTSAVELKWTHWLSGRSFLGLNNLRFSVLGGERMFAVDADAGNVFNLSELQTGALAIGGEWLAGERGRVLLLLGAEDYESLSRGEDYRGAYVYLSFSHRWN